MARFHRLPLLVAAAALLAVTVTLPATGEASALPCGPVRQAGTTPTHGEGGLSLPMTLDAVVDESRYAFAGTVERYQSCRIEAQPGYVTHVWIERESNLKGRAPSEGGEVRVTVPGGEVGDRILLAGNSPTFTVGERVVVFGTKDPSLGSVVANSEVSKLTIDEGSVLGLPFRVFRSRVAEAAAGTLTPARDPVVESHHDEPPGFESAFAPLQREWAASALPLRVNMNASASKPSQISLEEARFAIANAMHSWQDIPGSYMAFGPLLNTSRTSADRACTDPSTNDTTWGISASHGSSTLATTYSCWDAGTLLLVDTDVQMDTDHYGSHWRVNGTGNCDGLFDFETVLLHEYGHVIGLGHPTSSSGCNQSTLCPVMDATYGGLQRTPCTDDVDGAEFIYSLGAGSVPAAPGGVQASLNGSSANLTWSDVSSEIGFEIWRADDACVVSSASDFELIDSVADGVLAYSDDAYDLGLTGSVYCYKVRAFNTNGDGPFSATALAGTSGATPTPSPTPSPPPTATPTLSPTPLPTPTPTPTPTIAPTAPPTPTVAPTPTTPSPTAPPATTTFPSPTAAGTESPSSPTPTPTSTAAPPPTIEPTATPAVTEAATPTPTATPDPTPAPTDEPGAKLHGDVNCNGEIETTDPLMILREIAALPVSADCSPAFDIDCDDSTNAVDALALLRHIAGLPPLESEPGCPVIGGIEAYEGYYAQRWWSVLRRAWR